MVKEDLTKKMHLKFERSESTASALSDLSETSDVLSQISDHSQASKGYGKSLSSRSNRRSQLSRGQNRLTRDSLTLLISEPQAPREVTKHKKKRRTTRKGKKAPSIERPRLCTLISDSTLCSRDLDDFIIFTESDNAHIRDSLIKQKNFDETLETVCDINDIAPPFNMHKKERIFKCRRNIINFATYLIVSLVVIMTMTLGRWAPFSKSPKDVQKDPHKTTLMSYEELIQLLLPITPFLRESLSNTPQDQALKWLMTTRVPSLSEDRIMRRYILATFYYSTDGSNWKDEKRKGWLSNDHECDWSGVECEDYVENSIVNSAITLDLHSMGLHNTIPIELSELQNLDALLLHDNGLSGKIPDSIIKLTKLRKLDLANNELSGCIPSGIGRMTKLEFLDLSSNKFQDLIPFRLGNLIGLLHLDLSYNMLSGEIPEEISYLKNLETLFLDSNDIYGKIPNQISELRYLRTLSISDNELFGTIPEELGELANLEVLKLADNALYGDVPIFLGDMSFITELDLSNNKLDGNIPETFRELNNLQVLRLDHNKMSGSIPKWLGSMSSLEILTLHENSFIGYVPKTLCDKKTECNIR